MKPITIALILLMACPLFAQTHAVRVLSANHDDNTVSVIDPQNKTVTAAVNVSGKPVSVIPTPDGASLLAACEESNAIDIIDSISNTVKKNVKLSGSPKALVSGGGSLVYVALYDKNSVEIVDWKQAKSVGVIPVGNAPTAMALGIDNAILYVGCEKSHDISVIDIAEQKVVKSINLYGVPTSIVSVGDGRIAVALRWLNGFVYIDPKTLAVSGGWTPYDFRKPLPPNGIFISSLTAYSDGSAIIALSAVEKLVYEVDATKSNYILGIAPTGANPTSIHLSLDGKTAYIANADDNTVISVDLARHVPVMRLNVGKKPVCVVVARVKIVE